VNEVPPAAPAGAAAPAAYDYITHSGPRLASWLVLAVFVYALLDTFFLNAYVFMTVPPYSWFAAVGAALALVTMVATRAAPRLEQIGVSLLLALAAGFASYPLASRIDQWTDSDGPQLIAYQYDGSGGFQSTAGTPNLDFTALSEPWPLNAGDTHQFELTQGRFGLYQVNLARIRKELQDGRVSITPVPVAAVAAESAAP